MDDPEKNKERKTKANRGDRDTVIKSATNTCRLIKYLN